MMIMIILIVVNIYLVFNSGFCFVLKFLVVILKFYVIFYVCKDCEFFFLIIEKMEFRDVR